MDLRRALARRQRGRLGLAGAGGTRAARARLRATGQHVPAGQRVEHAVALAQRLPPAGPSLLAPRAALSLDDRGGKFPTCRCTPASWKLPPHTPTQTGLTCRRAT